MRSQDTQVSSRKCYLMRQCLLFDINTLAKRNENQHFASSKDQHLTFNGYIHIVFQSSIFFYRRSYRSFTEQCFFFRGHSELPRNMFCSISSVSEYSGLLSQIRCSIPVRWARHCICWFPIDAYKTFVKLFAIECYLDVMRNFWSEWETIERLTYRLK